MYKMITPSGVWYITRKFLVTVFDNGGHRVYTLKPGEFYQKMRWAFFPIDKVVEPERKMFWLAFAPILRTMGVIE